MKVFSFANPEDHAISIRAKALAFEDEKSQVLLERIKLLAPSDASILVAGESGTGKELIARLVHNLSDRADHAFIAVNCGAFSETLIESELFGHEKGAFTGAVDRRPGWFEAAHSGTLFLDEIGDLPLSAQVKLLRVLQEREVVRVGSRQPVKIDVRLVAATNVNLEAAVRAGNFREDLYFRLNVAKLALLPLRERVKDILPLTRHFIGLYAKRLRIATPTITDAALHHLQAYSWPGNIRELENVIHQALLISQQDTIEAGDLQFSGLGVLASSGQGLSGHVAQTVQHQPTRDQSHTAHEALKAALVRLFEENRPDLWQDIENTVFSTAYEYCDRNQLQASRLLNLSRNIVRARLLQSGALKHHPSY